MTRLRLGLLAWPSMGDSLPKLFGYASFYLLQIIPVFGKTIVNNKYYDR